MSALTLFGLIPAPPTACSRCGATARIEAGFCAGCWRVIDRMMSTGTHSASRTPVSAS